MKMKFEHGALGFVGVLLAILFTTTLSDTTSGMTSVPRVSLFLKAPQRIAGAEILDWETASGPPAARSARLLSKAFMRMGYDLESILSGKNKVPRVFIVNIPADMAQIPENRVRRSVFFQSILPLVLQVNEEILSDRRRLWRLRYRAAMDMKVEATDRLWLAVLAERYRTKRGGDVLKTIDALLNRADVIPPSLALAQAAEESGWGTSRFVREGNAIFGQWATVETGNLVPLKRDAGKNHAIKTFPNLLDSVRSYAANLNTHRAYRGFRKARAIVRASGAALDGKALIANLKSYSARGPKYVKTIRSIIDANKLRLLDGARLGDI